METKKFIYDENQPPIHYRPGTSDEILIKTLLIDRREYLLINHPAKIVFDIGANIGVMAVILAEVYPDATIHCFEPVPTNLELLRLNTEHLNNVVIHEVALSNRKGLMTIHGSDDPTNHGGFSGHIIPEKEALTGCEVLVDRMRSVCEYIGIPDIIKIDCEGAEFDILTDIPEMLEKVTWITGELHGVKDFELLSRLSATHEVQCERRFGDPVWHFHAGNRNLFQKSRNSAPSSNDKLAVVK